MPSYVVAQLEIFDKKVFLEYIKLVPKTIQQFGGAVIASGVPDIVLEGNLNWQNIVIVEFPSAERAKQWWWSKEYSKAKEIREISAKSKMIILQGVVK